MPASLLSRAPRPPVLLVFLLIAFAALLPRTAVGLGRAAEAFARYEWDFLDIDLGGTRDEVTTVGASFSPSALRGGLYARERLTLAYSPHRRLLILQAQIVF